MSIISEQVDKINLLIRNHRSAKEIALTSKRKAKLFLLTSVKDVEEFCDINSTINSRSYRTTLDSVYNIVIDFYKENRAKLMHVEDVRKISKLYLCDTISSTISALDDEINLLIDSKKGTVERNVVIEDIDHSLTVFRSENTDGFIILYAIQSKEIEHEVISKPYDLLKLRDIASRIYKDILEKDMLYDEYKKEIVRVSNELHHCIKKSNRIKFVSRTISLHSTTYRFSMIRESNNTNIIMKFYEDFEETRSICARCETPSALDLIDTFLLHYKTKYLQSLPSLLVASKPKHQKVVEIDDECEDVEKECLKFEHSIRSLHHSNDNMIRILTIDTRTHVFCMKRSGDVMVFEHSINDELIEYESADIGTLTCENLIERVKFTFKRLLKRKSLEKCSKLSRSEYISNILVKAARELSADSPTYKLFHLSLTSKSPSAQKRFIEDAIDRGFI